MGRRPRELTTADCREMRRLYEAGVALQRIRSRYRISYERVLLAIEAAGGKLVERRGRPPRHPGWQPVSDDVLLAMLERKLKGESVTTLADELGVHRMTMATYLRYAEGLVKAEAA